MLELRDLTKRYGDIVALDGLSFAVEPGQVFGFVGPNGAGKTTAMRIVLGVLAPDSGAVYWDGRPVGEALRRRFGYLPEERGLYPKMKARDQLVYFARLHGLPAERAAANADTLLAGLGLAARARDRVEELSLGNQQRVQLAAALVHDPVALVLDEPFSGLDPVGVDVLSEVLLARAATGVPVIFSSHQLELVEQLCDAVAIISAGRLVACGPVGELRRTERTTLRIDLEVTSADGWADRTEGVEVLTRTEAGVLVSVAPGVDPGDVLDAARQAGRVRHFSVAEPTLAELFREVVQQ